MNKHERYIINEEEIALLERVEGITGGRKSSEAYMECSKEGLATFCSLQSRSNDLFFRRAEAAREVIDIIARKVGIDPDDTSYALYTLDLDGSSPIVRKIDELFSRKGEKATLKKRVDELEKENSILRSLIHTGSEKK